MLFATEITDPISSFLSAVVDTWGIDRQTYRLAPAEGENIYRPRYKVLPYQMNSLDMQPDTSSVISIRYVGTENRQWRQMAAVYSHQLRIVATAADYNICQNDRDYALLAIEKGITDRAIAWANYDYLGKFAIVTRVPPTFDNRINYICSATISIALGGKEFGGCIC